MSVITNLIVGESFSGASTIVQSLLTVIPKGQIGAIPIMATIRENISHSLQTTEHPVELGAAISDHSYREPAEISLECGWSNSSAEATLGAITNLIASGTLSAHDYVSGIYSQLVNLQQSRLLFSVVSTLRTFDNMLMTSLIIERDADTSQALMVTAVCREIIIVTTQATNAPTAAQLAPADTAGVTNAGSQPLLSNPSPSPGGAFGPTHWDGS